MTPQNQTSATEFFLLGFSDLPRQQLVLFLVFLTMYLLTLLGNTAIVYSIIKDTRLHSPMYFFLSNLSLADGSFTSVTIPKLLTDLFLVERTISFYGCMTQMYFFISLGNTESNLLGVMAYDRYVAICHPLHYSIVMGRKWCALLAAASWISACLHSLLHTIMASILYYCGPNHIHHFFCEIALVIKLSCTDITPNELAIYTEGAVSVMVPFVCILVSYIHIIAAILKIRSKEGRIQTFSTCSSHLIVVTLFYGTIFSIYFRPSQPSDSSLLKDRLVTVMYTMLTPMLNPFIYGLRNKAIKVALRKVLLRKEFHHNT
ncbi:olfactory receptor 1f45-like [Ambystoma mexicanum]|uniref:olfactory receptor 1f45-like n=1 Tax=Ambystoma mexicanum TaxID=8296 RepID=UPI0037E83379